MNALQEIRNLFSRVSLKVRRGLIAKLGLKLTNNYFLDSPYMGPKINVKRVGVHSEMQNIKMPSIFDSKEIFTFSFPKRFIYEIPNATIDPVTGLVYDEKGFLIAESSAWDHQRLLAEIPRPIIRMPKRCLEGRYLFLPTTPTYYHWLIEDLPVFLSALKLNPKIKILLGAHTFKPINDFVEQYISNSIIPTSIPIRVEKLILSAKTAGLGSPIPPHSTAHPSDLKLLRKWFSSYMKNETQPTQMIYLSRRRWNRGIKGEDILEKRLETLGFKIFHGDLNLFEQIELFSQAKLIVGASGAAMSNMVWMQKKSNVIQLHHTNIFYRFYFNIAKMCGLEYQFVEVPEDSWTLQEINKIETLIKRIIVQ